MLSRVARHVGSTRATGRRTIVAEAAALGQTTHDFDHMLPQPRNPKFKTAVVEIKPRTIPNGGSDKLTNGHRFDTVPIANGLLEAGMSCQVLQYRHENHDQFFDILKKFDGIMVRCNPGQINADGGSQSKFNDAVRSLNKTGTVAWPSPDVMELMGAKDALVKTKSMPFGLEDTYLYESPAEMRELFTKGVAFAPRVVKQNRGSSGEGIWIIELKSKDYCAKLGDRIAGDDEMLVMREANDDHVEEHTVGEFLEFCVNGRTAKSGKWETIGTGKYFAGGVEAGGIMVDQRFLPRISEGEARFLMVGPKLFNVEHYVYQGEGIGGAAACTVYEAGDPAYKKLQGQLEQSIPETMKVLGLEGEPLPLIWTADVIPVDDHISTHVLAEFNCSCVGVGGFLTARGKDSWTSVPAADREQGEKMCGLVGAAALDQLNNR